MKEQDRYMLVFTLGPVQSFISQARKTRDLWIGSLLFSKLMEAAMLDIDKMGTFIFPHTRTVESTPDIPNKYIALFHEASQARLAVQQSQRQIMEAWQQICSTVWRATITGHDDAETLAIWQRQTGVNPNDPDPDHVALDALFEVYWAIVGLQEQSQYEQSYGGWLEATEGRLAARKRLRDFKPREEPGEKSAISGEREILRGRDASSKAILQFWQDVARNHSAKDIDQEGKERLDAIDIVKRFAMKAGAIIIDKKPFQTPFPSTSSIATASFVERLLEVAIDHPPQALKEWLQVTGELSNKDLETTRAIPFLSQKAKDSGSVVQQQTLLRDGDLYFAETFIKRRLTKDYDIINELEAKRIAEQGNKTLQALLRATDELNITRPTPYYSVIQMDGDNMGILLSGAKDDLEHRAISQALSLFARSTVPDLVEKQYPARLVYAGGDDVLAFAPLMRDRVENEQPQHVLELAERIQKAYQEKVRERLQDQQDRERINGITASTGIVIAHHYTSLSYVLRSAREAENIAKKHYGKDALVLTLIRRSGEQTRVGCHWNYPQLEEAGFPQPIALFSRFYQLLKADVLSPKCVHILLEEAPALVHMGNELNAVGTSSAMQSEIKRVLMRQRNPAKKEAFKDDEVKELARHLTGLALAMDIAEYPREEDGKPRSVELHSDRQRYGLVEVLGWLLIMAFLARKEQE